MNKVFKLIWNNSLGQWIVCSELGRKGKSSSKVTLLIGGVLISSASLAVECTKGTNGSVTVNNTNNTDIIRLIESMKIASRNWFAINGFIAIVTGLKVKFRLLGQLNKNILI